MTSPLRTTIDRHAHAEAFRAWQARLVVTAEDAFWAEAAAHAFCGYGSSVIGCDAEVAVDRTLSGAESPDGRPGFVALAFAFRAEPLGRAVANRVGQSLLTCPTVSLWDGLPEAPRRAPLGDWVRYFGDGRERRDGAEWVLPIMEGEARLPATVGLAPSVAGGNLVLCGVDPAATLLAARVAAVAAAAVDGAITPFPGGVCRSGSKVGSRYASLVASTNEAYCPTLRAEVASRLPADSACAYEVVVNGADEAAVRAAMRAAMRAVLDLGVAVHVTAADYGGRLGSIRIPLGEVAP